MKRKRNIFPACRKRMLSFLLSAAMVFGCAAPVSAAASGTSSPPQVQGVITNLVLRNVKGIALEYLERAVLTGLGKAAENTDGTMSDILSLTKRLLGSSQGVANSKITSMCKQMIDQLNDIETDLNETRAALDKSIGQVSQQISKTNVDEDRSTINAFNATYTEVLNQFEELTAALQNYAEKSDNGTLTQTDIDRLNDAYDKIDAFYKSSGDAENTQMTFNFYDDLMKYLQVISPYIPSTELADDLSDESKWGSKSSRETFMDHLYDYASSGMAFEHQIYDTMSAGMNEAVVPLTTYLTAYRLYVEYKVQDLNSDPTLSESDRSAKIRQSWDAYYLAQNRIVRAIQQMTSLYDDQIGSYMRSYDVSQSIRMDYHSSGSHYKYKNMSGWQTSTLYASSTAEYMPFYVVKPLVSGSDVTYAINQWTGKGVQYARNITYNSGFEYWGSTCYVFSQDYYNLLKTANEDSGYSTIHTGSDLNTLTNTKAFSLSGYYMKTYLQEQGGLPNVAPISNKSFNNDNDTKKKGSFALLSGRDTWKGASADVTLLNISMQMQPGELSKPEVEISTGDINQNKFGTNFGSDPLLIIMKSNSSSRTISNSVSNGSMKLYSVDSNGNRTELSWNSTVKSGTRLEIHITPSDGMILDTLKLLNNEGEELYSFASDYTEASQLDVSEDGSYVVTMPMAYQNVKVSASCINNPQIYKAANLDLSTDGDLQFEGRNGMSTIEYASGDTVTFYARPYTGKLVDTVTVTAKDGSVISCTEMDSIPNTPNEKGYSFKMPDQDVTITATYKNANTVSFENSSNGYAMIDDTCMNEDWLKYPVAYNTGDTVSIKTVADDNYFCSNTQVMGVKSGSKISAQLTDTGITFKMPDESVIIRTSFDSLGSGSRVKLEDNTGNYQTMSFAPLNDGTKIQSNEYHFSAGSTVKIQVSDQGQPVDSSAIRVVDYYSEPLEYTYDEENQVISFTMPDKNVSVYPPAVLFGSGTEEEPYELRNYDTLVFAGKLINDTEGMSNAIFEVTADIDGEGKDVTPIAAFSGQLDGNGHTISNLNLTGEENTGLFSVINAKGTVSDLNLTGIQAKGTDGQTAILAGENSGTVTNCHVSQATVSGSGILGGIVGNNQGYILKSGVESVTFNSAETAGIGGIAGSNSSTLTDCYTQDMAVEGSFSNIGGIAGVLTGASPMIDSCYVTVSLTQGGIIAGENTAAVAQVRNCYYLTDHTSIPACAKGSSLGWELTGKNTDAFTSGEVTYVLNESVSDGSQSWYQNLPETDAADAIPQHSGLPVYYYEGIGYSNHHYVNGICDDCKAYQAPAHADSDGAYEIRNAGELFWFAQQVNTVNSKQYARLMCDIDLENLSWTPIGLNEEGKYFNGVLDGQGYAIKNLNVNASSDFQGLFGCITSGALIKDLGIESGTVTGNNYVGGIVGAARGSGRISIERCYNNASVTARDRNAAGILGCRFDSVTVNIEDCYNSGAIKGARESAGISGWLNGDFSLLNCYNTGSVTGADTNRIMFRYGSTGHVSNNYYLNTLGKQDTATAMTADQFKSGEVTWRLNGSTAEGDIKWYQTLGEDDAPVLDASHNIVIRGSDQGYENLHPYDDNGFCTVCGNYEPAVRNAEGIYEIGNAGQLFWYAALVDDLTDHAEFKAADASASAVLINDIDLEDREWQTIGLATPYSGTFDGQGYTIEGMSITEPGTNTGLFGYCRGAEIKNLTVKGNIQLSADSSKIGGIAGNIDKGTISNVVSYVNISNSDGTLAHVGGIVGCLAGNRNDTLVEKAMYYGTIDVTHSTDCIGGIVGYSNGNGTLRDCANVGTVSSTENDAAPMIGGILGYANSTVIRMNNCYNYGSVSADIKNSCGAVIGMVKQIGTYANCYYLDGSAEKGTGSGSDPTIKKSADAFASGEVAYLLNTEGEIVQNRNIWSQGEQYPVLAKNQVNAVHRVIFQYTDKNNELVHHATHYINGGKRLTLPEAPSLDKQKFLGWFTTRGEEVKQDFIVVRDMTITGKFQDADAASADLPGTADGTQGNGTSSKVKTGDDTNMVWFYVLVASGAVIAAAAVARRKRGQWL